jgi:hypothetical protein
MKTLIFIKSIVFLLSLFFTGMFLDDFIENLILFAKEKRMNLFPIGLWIFTIICWSIFYCLSIY